ncbi:transglycosylase family protein [Streptomyces xantholiticus]|uniref:Transglycosylase family protein n=1 Tax=Streptomyces xantholiticus TaxID=68285 RepID=A0ABV1UWX9_9ACTN
MLSGNGRHRRPRQAPALIVAAGVTGSAIAIPLLGAGSASAAEASTWDRVAECESGGAWSADFGNGFYGGLQFSQETWAAYGGTAYAPSADLASRSQQIAVAEKVLAAEGPEAWPACGPLAGLKDDGADTGVDPGILPLPQESDAPADEASPDASETSGVLDPAESADATGSETSEDSSGESGTSGDGDASQPSGDPTGQPVPEGGDAATAPAGDAAEAAPSDEATSGTGKHRGAPADDEAKTGNADDDRETGRHASRGDSSGRDGVDGSTGPGAYTVQPGDNLCDIATAQEVPGGWPALYEANEEAVGADPDLILPGQRLDLGLVQG